MHEEIDEGEEDGEGLLHAEESVERPFSVELKDGLRVGDTLIGDYVLAGVVAFGGAVPEQEFMEERDGGFLAWRAVLAFADLDAFFEIWETVACRSIYTGCEEGQEETRD